MWHDLVLPLHKHRCKLTTSCAPSLPSQWCAGLHNPRGSSAHALTILGTQEWDQLSRPREIWPSKHLTVCLGSCYLKMTQHSTSNPASRQSSASSSAVDDWMFEPCMHLCKHNPFKVTHSSLSKGCKQVAWSVCHTTGPYLVAKLCWCTLCTSSGLDICSPLSTSHSDCLVTNCSCLIR